MMISVALAYYNGKNYIGEQLESILCQLGPGDEIVISVDKADDGSYELLEKWTRKDERIRLTTGPGKGVVQNFEHAIRQCKGDYLFLSDQDDIWAANKVRKVLWAFEQSGASVILHNARQVDREGQPNGEPDIFAVRKSRPGILKNLILNSYMGCCMAFKKELLPLILPIPREIYMHDYWIGTAGEMAGGTALVKAPLLSYRRHDDNVTEMHHGSVRFMLKKRLSMIGCLFILRKRRRLLWNKKGS